MPASAGAVGLGWFGTGADPDEEEPIPQPAAGLLPLTWAASLLMLPTTLASFDVESPLGDLQLYPGTVAYFVVDVVVVAALTVGLVWLLYQPARVGSHLSELNPSRRGAHPIGRAVWLALELGRPQTEAGEGLQGLEFDDR